MPMDIFWTAPKASHLKCQSSAFSEISPYSGRRPSSDPYPVLPFLVFLEFVFLSVFPSFPRDFRASIRIKNPCSLGGFPCLFPKKNKERKGKVFGGFRRGAFAKGGSLNN